MDELECEECGAIADADEFTSSEEMTGDVECRACGHFNVSSEPAE